MTICYPLVEVPCSQMTLVSSYQNKTKPKACTFTDAEEILVGQRLLWRLQFFRIFICILLSYHLEGRFLPELHYLTGNSSSGILNTTSCRIGVFEGFYLILFENCLLGVIQFQSLMITPNIKGLVTTPGSAEWWSLEEVRLNGRF